MDKDRPPTPPQNPRKIGKNVAGYSRHHDHLLRADPGVPDRSDAFLLAEGELKVTSVDDSRLPNTTIFTFNKEDHTLGNLIASRLHKYGYVTFSAYKMHHPLTPAFDLRVSTDGTVTPRDAVLTCCKDVLVDLDTVSREFTKEMELYRIANAGKPTANTNGNVNGSGPSGTNL